MSGLRSVAFAAMMFAAVPAVAQFTRLPGPFPAQLQSYLELTRDQVTAITRLNDASMQFQSEKLRRSLQVQLEIGQETAKPALDAMALGLRYLELEAIRRELAADRKKPYAEIQKILTPAQKPKGEALIAARPLQPVICAAEAQNILPPGIPGNIIPADRGIPILTPGPGTGSFGSFLLGPSPTGLIGSLTGGCATRWFDLTGAPAPAAQ